MEGFHTDDLKLYFGEDIKITDGIILKSPKIGQIMEYGEQKYFALAQQICATPSSMKLALDQMQLDWNKIDDFQLFAMLCKSMPQKDTEILLGDLDLSQLDLYNMKDGDKVVLSNKTHTVAIDNIVYEMLVGSIRQMHGFQKQVDKAGNRSARRAMLMAAKQDLKISQNKGNKSILRPMISAVKCRMGYTLDYVKQMSIFELTDD